MITFEWWWSLFLLPLPLLVRRYAGDTKQNSANTLFVPFFDVIGDAVLSQPNKNSVLIKQIALYAVWAALVIAAARPQLFLHQYTIPISGRDLMIAVDLSGSMAQKDLSNQSTESRLDVVKDVLNDFLSRRETDRIALILFGSQPYLQTPFTFDIKTVQHFLDEAVVGLAGETTAIGDTIVLSAKYFNDSISDNRVMILLTDGQNTAGKIKPLDAANLAKDKNIKIYTIGVGGNQTQINTFFGTITAPKSELDETTLKEIASITGGKYFRADDQEMLDEVIKILNQLEAIEVQEKTIRPKKEMFYWPLAFALLGLVFVSIISARRLD